MSVSRSLPAERRKPCALEIELREYAEALDKDRGHSKSRVTAVMREAADEVAALLARTEAAELVVEAAEALTRRGRPAICLGLGIQERWHALNDALNAFDAALAGSSPVAEAEPAKADQYKAQADAARRSIEASPRWMRESAAPPANRQADDDGPSAYTPYPGWPS